MLMDILNALSNLLMQDAASLEDKAPEYRQCQRAFGHIQTLISEKAGEELMGKLIDIQGDIDQQDFLRCFLYGVRVGMAASDLGQGG